jgi:hypothetical protein
VQPARRIDGDAAAAVVTHVRVRRHAGDASEKVLHTHCTVDFCVLFVVVVFVAVVIVVVVTAIAAVATSGTS